MYTIYTVNVYTIKIAYANVYGFYHEIVDQCKYTHKRFIHIYRSSINIPRHIFLLISVVHERNSGTQFLFSLPRLQQLSVYDCRRIGTGKIIVHVSYPLGVTLTYGINREPVSLFYSPAPKYACPCTTYNTMKKKKNCPNVVREDSIRLCLST